MKKLLSIMVACLVVSGLSVRPVAASSNAEKEARLAGKVKSGIEKLGSGTNTRVEVKLRDKTRLKGYVSEISENAFVVTDVKTGASNNVAYAEVKQIKGNNMSTGAKIAIGVSVAIGLILLISWLIIASSD
ncbi:MAG TPA: hypothetical protein VGJ66_11560 [Pyrinomonadaceae bacterium]|jgi:hypothetical protein